MLSSAARFSTPSTEVSVTLEGQLQKIIDELVQRGIPLDLAKKEFERKYLATAVRASGGNLGQAAESLGIHRNTLRHKMEAFEVKLPPNRGRA